MSRSHVGPTAPFTLVAGLALILAAAAAQAQQAGTILRSRIDRWTGRFGSAGIPYVPVRLLDPDTDSVVADRATDSEGMFRFRGVLPGKYKVRVNRERAGCGFLEFEAKVDARHAEYTNVRPVMVHELSFNFDPLGRKPDTGTVIEAGYEYDNPPDWPVYVLAADRQLSFRLPPLWSIDFPGRADRTGTGSEAGQHLAEQRAGVSQTPKPWSSDQPGFDGGAWKGVATLQVAPGDSSIHAVLLTADGMRTVDSLTSAGADRLDRLPAGSRTLTRMPVYE
ncbi:MAG: hypothetical protein JSU73_04460 [candidate division WOR-3 bacterium]|nr:MAG: hypothetical protein JSU73_04460 [candidate division WOR-3 bacterium]